MERNVLRAINPPSDESSDDKSPVNVVSGMQTECAILISIQYFTARFSRKNKKLDVCFGKYYSSRNEEVFLNHGSFCTV
jgi:hypothetical protein